MNSNRNFQNGFNHNLLNGVQNGGKPPFLHRMVNGVQSWCKEVLQKIENSIDKHDERQEQEKIQALKNEDPLLSNKSTNSYNTNTTYNPYSATSTTPNDLDKSMNPRTALTSHLNNLTKGWKNPKVRDKWIKRGSIIALIVLSIGIGGGAGIHAYMHHISNADESSKPSHEHVSFIAKAQPNSMIFTNGEQAGRTDKRGLYRFTDLPVHTKVYAIYGKTRSKVYKLTKSDNHTKLNIKFNCPSKHRVQKYVDKMYACLSNLINHNNPVSGNYSLDSFFATSSGERTYHALYGWAKRCNLQLDETPKPKIRIVHKRVRQGKRMQMRTFKIKTQPKFVQIGALQGIHFVKTVQHVALAKDGSLIIRYRIETIYNRSHRDHITDYNWIAQMKKVNGRWKIVRAQSAAKPVKSYNP